MPNTYPGSAVGAVSDEQVPTVPECGIGPLINSREAMLLWLPIGRGTVRVAGQRYGLVAGHAIWIAPGVEYSLALEAHSVALPILLPAELADSPVHFAVPESWADRLVFEFCRTLGYLRDTATSSDERSEGRTGSVTALMRALTAAQSAGPTPAALLPRPKMPRSPEALTVARSLLTAPYDEAQLAEHARRAGLAQRSLQRRFLAETGLSFSRWRTALRVSLAAELIAEGREIGWSGRQVGFQTAAGITRAFQEWAGSTPSAYRDRIEGWASAAQRACEVQDGPVPVVAAAQTWTRVNDFHTAVWALRGHSSVQIGAQRVELVEGDVVVLPAGVVNEVTLPEGSLLVPLGSLTAWTPVHGTGTVVRFPAAARTFLLHCLMANYTRIRPTLHDPSRVVRLVLDAATGSTASRGRDVDAAVALIIDAIRSDPADTRTLTQWSADLAVDVAELRRRFAATTGQTFPRWRAHVRMTMARHYIAREGLPTAGAARRLGYAHPSTFSKAFAQAHGVPPRVYRRSGWRPSGERLLDR